MFYNSCTHMATVGVKGLNYCDRILLDPVLNQYEACNKTVNLPFNERLLLAERIIYVAVASLLAWFVFEVRATFTNSQGCYISPRGQRDLEAKIFGLGLDLGLTFLWPREHPC